MQSPLPTSEDETTPSPQWLARVKLGQIPALAPYRLLPFVEGTILRETVWLRSDHESFPEELYSVSGLERFDASIHGRQLLLHPPGKLLPTEAAPSALADMEWLPLSEILAPTPPVAMQSGIITPRNLSLVDNPEFSEPNLLILNDDDFKKWVCDAPEVRLRPLRFCRTSRNSTMVWGSPLPPLSGERWNEFCGMAVPAGKIWHPTLPADSLCQIIRSPKGSVTLLHESGTMEVIHEECWLPVTRANIRVLKAGDML